MTRVGFGSNENKFHYVPQIKTLPGRLVLVSGPSGVGKGTLINKMFEDKDVKGSVDKVLSLTTRDPRPSELPASTITMRNRILKLHEWAKSWGINLPYIRLFKSQQYEYVTKDHFQTLAAKNQLFQSASYDGNFYGSRTSEVVNKLKRGINVLFELASKDALQIKQSYPDKVTTVFIAPPTSSEGLPETASKLDMELNTLRGRLVKRGTNSEASIQERLEKAKAELALEPQFDVVIVNEDNQEEVGTAKLKAIATQGNAAPRFSGLSLKVNLSQDSTGASRSPSTRPTQLLG